MKFFAIGEPKTTKTAYSIGGLSLIFTAVLVVIFTVISFFAKIYGWINQTKEINIANQSMNEIAFYFWPIDKNIAKMILGIEELSQAYLQGENILKTKKKEISSLIYYIQKNKNYFNSLGFQKYEYLIDLLTRIGENQEEVRQLLGQEKPQNYLVILQNTNEKRPNGGFFGSFAFITVDKARITNLEIIDAYYPDYFAPNARIKITSWQKKLFPNTENIGFIDGNKFGFTNLDGKNLKDLYEMSFNTHYNQQKLSKLINPKLHTILLNKYIKGVIFVRLDMFTKYFPQLEEQSWEWQFVNANIDLIRGEVKADKKEKYIKEANLFFQDNRKGIFKAVVNNLEEIIQQRGINIYLSNVSTELQNILESSKLKTSFSTGKIYFWDKNITDNKVDAFIKKNIEVYDKKGNLVVESDNDIVSIQNLLPGTYDVKIYYSFNMPSAYVKKMRDLEAQYAIKMTTREQKILGLIPQDYATFINHKKNYRGTNATIYFPKHVDFMKKSADKTSSKKNFVGEKYSTSFSHVLKYVTFISKNNQTKTLEFQMTIPSLAKKE